jgi:hypothetical protein
VLTLKVRYNVGTTYIPISLPTINKNKATNRYLSLNTEFIFSSDFQRLKKKCFLPKVLGYFPSFFLAKNKFIDRFFFSKQFPHFSPAAALCETFFEKSSLQRENSFSETEQKEGEIFEGLEKLSPEKPPLRFAKKGGFPLLYTLLLRLFPLSKRV